RCRGPWRREPSLARNVGGQIEDPLVINIEKVGFAWHGDPGEAPRAYYIGKQGLANEIWQIWQCVRLISAAGRWRELFSSIDPNRTSLRGPATNEQPRGHAGWREPFPLKCI
ncbi:MAG: hypothetical protein ACREDV_02310, partial [Methylocella sp.]